MSPNKAHTATANRIARRYDGERMTEGRFDIVCEAFVVAVETTATLQTGVEKLRDCEQQAYLAVTNREALPDALKAVEGTGIGVMDPQGEIVRAAE